MQDHPLLLALGFAGAVAGTALYLRVARRLGIVATPNQRTLHAGIVPRGGGVVVALTFLAGVTFLFALGELPGRWFLALAGGGLVITAVGFIDDVADLSMRARVVAHLIVALWAAAWLGRDLSVEVGTAHIEMGWLGYAFAAAAVVCMVNLFNFMDGIDGIEASGVLWFSSGALAILEWRGGSALSAPIALLGVASAGFLLFNWPPARLFLGDAGSGFYGYAFSVLILVTMTTGEISLWTWIILLAYFLGDTTTTLVIRMWTVPRFYSTHRSHAYQNLARLWQNHRRMTLIVLAIDLVWLLPLAAASVKWPHLGPLFAATALSPVVGLAIKYGPLHDR